MVVPQTEAARSATTNPQSTNPVKNQPPLHATGFIQGEHGTLIPVYQPDALDEYMNGSTTGHVGGGSASAPVSTQQTGGIFSAPVWPGYAAPPMITYPLQPTTTAGVTNSTPQNCQQQGGNHQSQGSPRISTTTSMLRVRGEVGCRSPPELEKVLVRIHVQERSDEPALLLNMNQRRRRHATKPCT